MNHKDKNEDGWIEVGSEFVESYRHLITLKIVEHTSWGASVGVVGILCLVMAMFVLLFLGLGSAWWLGEYLGDMKAGLFIVGGVYMLIFALLLLVYNKTLIAYIRDIIIRKIYEQD